MIALFIKAASPAAGVEFNVSCESTMCETEVLLKAIMLKVAIVNNILYAAAATWPETKAD